MFSLFFYLKNVEAKQIVSLVSVLASQFWFNL